MKTQKKLLKLVVAFLSFMFVNLEAQASRNDTVVCTGSSDKKGTQYKVEMNITGNKAQFLKILKNNELLNIMTSESSRENSELKVIGIDLDAASAYEMELDVDQLEHGGVLTDIGSPGEVSEKIEMVCR